MVNARVDATLLRRDFPASADAMALIGAYLADGSLSQRGVDRVLRLSWTLADLDGDAQPNLDHVARAVDLRSSPAEGVAA